MGRIEQCGDVEKEALTNIPQLPLTLSKKNTFPTLSLLN